MTVCSKTVLFQFIGEMNSFFNHSNGIKVFSCTEPPCGKSDSQWGELMTRQRDYIFQWRQKNGTHNIRCECWLRSVCGNSISNVPWGAKKKAIFLKQSRDCINYWRLLKLTRSYFLTHWRGCCCIKRGGIGSLNYNKRSTSLPRHRCTGIRWGVLTFRRALDCNQGKAQTEVSLQGGGDFTVHRRRHPVPWPAD